MIDIDHSYMVLFHVDVVGTTPNFVLFSVEVTNGQRLEKMKIIKIPRTKRSREVPNKNAEYLFIIHQL